MKNYRQLMPPVVPMNGTARASVFVTQMAERQRHRGKGQQPAKLDGWEDEGGTLAAPNALAP